MAAKVHLRPSHDHSIKVHPFFRQQSKAFCQADFGLRILEKNPNDTSQTTIKKNPLVDAMDSLPCSHGASSAPNYTKKRKYRQKEAESAYDHSSEYYEYEEEQSEHVKVKKTKRNRTSKVHSLSERRRREKINKKMRTLQDLLPNCNKVDKVSVLDEAIEYLKTLQIQLQMQILIMSMRSGMYMTPQIPMMMLPPGMHLARCSPMSMANSRMSCHLNVQPTPNTSLSPKSWPNQV